MQSQKRRGCFYDWIDFKGSAHEIASWRKLTREVLSSFLHALRNHRSVYLLKVQNLCMKTCINVRLISFHHKLLQFDNSMRSNLGKTSNRFIVIKTASEIYRSSSANDAKLHLCALIMNSSVKPTIRYWEKIFLSIFAEWFCGWRSKSSVFFEECFEFSNFFLSLVSNAHQLRRMLENA